MYIATKYIGKKYTPGEILPDNLPADEVKWLLEAGAIRKAAPAPGQPVEPDNGEEGTQEPEAPATPDDEQEPEAPDEATDEESAQEPEDEIDEEAEAPEIDVMDGLVPAKEEKPARTAARKPAAKKGGKTK